MRSARNTRLAHLVNKVWIEIDGQVCRQFPTASPMTIGEVWHWEPMRRLGPSRIVRMTPEGIAVVSVNCKSYTEALAQMVTDPLDALSHQLDSERGASR